MKKVAFITGASSGMGLSTAKKFLEKGFIVYGGARRVERMEQVEGLRPIKMDVTNAKDVENAVKKIIDQEGRIDVLFNNAGYGLFGAVETVSDVEAKRQFDVNVLGLAKVCKTVLPYMREAQSGVIINNSSMGGRTYMPFGAYYHATKYAVEGFSDCLRFEVKQFGIKVVIIEPGNVESEWTDIMIKNLTDTTLASEYGNQAEGMIKLTKSLKNFTPSEKIAEVVYKAATAKNPKTRYLVGKNTYSVFLRKILSDKSYDKLFEKLISE